MYVSSHIEASWLHFKPLSLGCQKQQHSIVYIYVHTHAYTYIHTHTHIYGTYIHVYIHLYIFEYMCIQELGDIVGDMILFKTITIWQYTYHDISVKTNF